MKLRAKIILFLGLILISISISVFFYAKYVVGNIFKKQAISNIHIVSEQSESAFISFLNSMKIRVLDWTSDNTIRETSMSIIDAKEGSPIRANYARKFTEYVRERKMPFDETITLVDLLDKNGIVVASTKPERIGRNEKDEEQMHLKTHDFEHAINSNFGEAFFGTIVLNNYDNPEPTLNVTARLFNITDEGGIEPIDAVLLVYYANMSEIADILGTSAELPIEPNIVTKRMTSKALLSEYNTSELYLVNNERIMVTPSRSVKDVRLKQSVNTLPVNECLENGKEISDMYDNYNGVRVFGASMCFQREGIVVIVEIQEDEVLAPMVKLVKSTVSGILIILFLEILFIILFIKKPLNRIKNIIITAKRVEDGDLNASADTSIKDELGDIAISFNKMIESVRNTEKDLIESKRNIEKEKAKDEALLASLGEGMIATDKEGKFIAINPVAEKMLDLKSEDVIGKLVVDVVEAIDENNMGIPNEQSILNIALKGTPSSLSTMRYKRKDDGYFPVAVTWTPVILGGKTTGAVGIFRDITEEKQIEKTREDLLSLASHQLRTPLSGTKWLIETLKKGIHGPLTTPQTEYLDELYKINERMTSLVHDMLGVLRLEGGDTKTKKVNASTKAILVSAFETMRGVAESKHITINTPSDSDFEINTDPLLLRNILESLVGNAINYSESGREVSVWAERKPKEIMFTVKDSGIGIPKAEQRQIFERFYRASNAKTFDTRGSGLGLYIASMLAKKIGARLSFESEEGKGSTFYVHLPDSSTGVL